MTVKSRGCRTPKGAKPEALLNTWKEAAMSNRYFPPEILIHIVDNLHDEPQALRDCCLVARSWVPLTRKHLFAVVRFRSPKDLETWKKTFPDPSNSPAYYTHSLWVQCPQIVTAADAEEGGWIRSFSHVVNLNVESSVDGLTDSEISLVPFHGISPVLKSLFIGSTLLPYSQIFGLIRSLPLLEDLSLVGYRIANDNDLDVGGPPTVAPPPSALALTGGLGLILLQGVGPITRRLLGIPSGLHFKIFTVAWIQEGDLQWINALVVGCSDTLERLGVMRFLLRIFWLLR